MRGSRRPFPHRWLLPVLLVIGVSVLPACATTFPKFQPDRCHRSDPNRDTLNWDIFCFQSP